MPATKECEVCEAKATVTLIVEAYELGVQGGTVTYHHRCSAHRNLR